MPSTTFDRGKPDSDRRDCRDVGPIGGGGGELSGLRDSLEVAPQPILPQAVGFAGQRQHRQAAAVGSTVSLSAHALPRRTFSEPLAPPVGRRYGRRVGRCDALVRAVAVALEGRPGSRMMARLSVSWSRDTMLRVLRRGDPAAMPPPRARVVGIDDFAWRRGHSWTPAKTLADLVH